MSNIEESSKTPVCEECLNTGICGDGGPGMRNAHQEWVPCDCPAGRQHKTIPEEWPEWKAEKRRMADRILVLEDTLNEIYHWTDSTTRQIEIINKVLPQGATAPDGPPVQKTFHERLLSLADWLRGRVISDALPSTTMTMLQQRVDRLDKWKHKKP